MKHRAIVAIPCVVFAFASGCDDNAGGGTVGNGQLKLAIITPHDDRIQATFADGFNAARAKAGQPPVTFEWNVHGTNEAVKIITDEFAAAGRRGPQAGINYDLFFGGGRPAFDALKQAGCTQAVKVSDAVLAGVPKTLNGIPIYDPAGHWYGAVLAAFGIVYNRDGLREKGIPEPKTWTDLADPRLRGWVVLVDPSKSGSVAVCYEMILQKYGWEKGWGLLMRMAGNARDILSSSRSVPREVGQGSALAGPCIDFYGYAQVQADGPEHVGYINPAAATAFTPDPLCVLKNPPHRQLAEDFLAFVLSPAGQALWALPDGHADKPPGPPLYRLPIRPDVYGQFGDVLVVKDRPFAADAAFEFDPRKEEQRAKLLGPLFDAAFLKNKPSLDRAWAVIVEKGLPPDLLAEFESVPFAETEGFELARAHASDSRRAIELDEQWFAFFRAKYEKIIASN